MQIVHDMSTNDILRKQDSLMLFLPDMFAYRINVTYYGALTNDHNIFTHHDESYDDYNSVVPPSGTHCVAIKVNTKLTFWC